MIKGTGEEPFSSLGNLQSRMSKRIEGQEVEAFSSLGNLNAMQGSSLSFNIMRDTSLLGSRSSSARFLEPPFENQHRNHPSSSSNSSSKQLNSSSKQAHHSRHLLVSSVATSSHQAIHSHHQLTSLPPSHQANHVQPPLACPPHDNAESPLVTQASTHTPLPPLDHHLAEYKPKPKDSVRVASKPLNVVTGIFTCWSKNKEKSGSFQHSFSRQPLDKLSEPVLFEQTRLQQEALAETQDTRDMWEWQMEQQQAITSQEHGLFERNTMENPIKVLPGLMGRNSSANRSTNSAVSMVGQLTRTTSDNSVDQSKDCAGVDAEHEQRALVVHHRAQGDVASTSGGAAFATTAGSESPSWDVYSQVNNIWHDADVVSAMMLLFESALLRCRAEVAYFCRVYMQQMVLSGYALIRTLMEMEPNTVFARKVHASYALEGHVHAVMFQWFESDSFDKGGVTRILDPGARAAAHAEEYVRMKGVEAEEALRAGSEAYEEAFHAYCAVKSEEVMGMFAWMSMGYRTAAERDRFMEAFLRAAKWVWLLHRLANSTHPPMHILRVGRGHIIDPAYVESVCVPSIGTCPNCPASSPPKVEFMIMPGFISPSRKIFRCKAYQHYMCKRAPGSQ